MSAERFKQSTGVRSEPLTSKKRARPRIGFLRPGHIENAFIVLLYVTLLALVVLSVLGTFYGMRGAEVPLSTPGQIAVDAWTSAIWLAVGIQAALSLTQYGARQMARHDRRWWMLYLVALAISVYYNVQAYWGPLSALTAWYVAAVLIVAGDILPEFLAVQHE